MGVQEYVLLIKKEKCKKKKKKKRIIGIIALYIYIYVLVGLAEKFSSLPCILTCYCLVIYLLPSEIFTSSRNESAIIICCSKKKKKKVPKILPN